MKMKKSSQWTQFMQDFNGVWTRDLTITGTMLYELSYEATDVWSQVVRVSCCSRATVEQV